MTNLSWFGALSGLLPHCFGVQAGTQLVNIAIGMGPRELAQGNGEEENQEPSKCVERKRWQEFWVNGLELHGFVVVKRRFQSNRLKMTNRLEFA